MRITFVRKYLVNKSGLIELARREARFLFQFKKSSIFKMYPQ